MNDALVLSTDGIILPIVLRVNQKFTNKVIRVTLAFMFFPSYINMWSSITLTSIIFHRKRQKRRKKKVFSLLNDDYTPPITPGVSPFP